MVSPSIEIYERTDGRWGWRLIAGNGRTIATDGGQGYENRADCEQMANDVVGGYYAPTDHPTFPR